MILEIFLQKLDIIFILIVTTVNTKGSLFINHLEEEICRTAKITRVNTKFEWW